MRQDPLGVRRVARGIHVGKDKINVKNELTSLDDKLRIADKVHAKYLGLGHEKIEALGQLLREVGAEAEFIFAEAARKNSRGRFLLRVRGDEVCYGLMPKLFGWMTRLTHE